jgi:Nitroreductase
MNFIQLAEKRYSVRSYHSKAVESEKIETILKAGWLAPTAANQQPNQFLVINTAEGFIRLAKGTHAHQAPLAIIVCADKSLAWKRPFDDHIMTEIDATIATDHMMLCAEDLGLASCWLTYFDPEVIRREFNIPDILIPVNILAIGYSADPTPQSANRHEKTRKPFAQIVKYNSF